MKHVGLFPSCRQCTESGRPRLCLLFTLVASNPDILGTHGLRPSDVADLTLGVVIPVASASAMARVRT